MTLDRFERERAGGWRALEGALTRARGRPERLGASGVLELGALYRGAAADLALARRLFPGDPLTVRLEALVVRARQVVYADVGPAPGADARSSPTATGGWSPTGGWRWLIAATLFIGGTVFAFVVGRARPGRGRRPGARDASSTAPTRRAAPAA